MVKTERDNAVAESDVMKLDLFFSHPTSHPFFFAFFSFSLLNYFLQPYALYLFYLSSFSGCVWL